jgi:transforming growth factor-beta-induced protein
MMGTFKRPVRTLAFLGVVVIRIVTSQSSGGTIIEILSSSPEFSQLKAYIDLAGIADDLAINGATVFAPSNTAFSSMPLELVTSLMSDEWLLHLKNLLMYHIVGREVLWNQFEDGTTQETLIDEPINVVVSNGNVVINGAATVVEGDIRATNGVIHAIDNVLTPSWYTRSISDVVSSDSESFSNFLGLGMDSLISLMSSPGPFTLFAPINAGFDELNLSGPTSAAPSFFQDVLRYHIVDGIYTGMDLMQVNELDTLLGGQKLKFELDQVRRGLTVDGQLILQSDVLTNNGIVHIVEGVLIPNIDPQMDECIFLKTMEEARGLESGVQCGCERIDGLRVELTCTDREGSLCAPKYAACNESVSCCNSSLRRCVGGQCRDATTPERVKLSSSAGGAEARVKYRIERNSKRNLRG